MRFSRQSSAYILGILLGTLLVVPALLNAQPPTTGSTFDLETLLKEDREIATIFGPGSGEVMPVSRHVDPEAYRVGPNDRLLISSAGLGVRIPAVVGYDNILVLPRGLAPIDVTGLTLAEVGDRIDSLFSARGGSWGEIAVALFQPRAIYVTVSGAVVAPGLYAATSADRVSTAIAAASRVPKEIAALDEETTDLTKETTLGRASDQGTGTIGADLLGGNAHRRIVVRHADGSSSRADLVRYRAFGQNDDNPSLVEGDEIVVSPPDALAERISVAGGVASPVVGLPWREGDNLAMLVALSGGLLDEARPEEAYLIRSTSRGEERIDIDLGDSASLLSFRLVGGDQLIVPVRYPVRPRQSGVVAVRGEVLAPQAYSIVPGETTLTDIIERAGGFTPLASLNGAYIQRPDDPLALSPERRGIERQARMSTSSLYLDDTLRFNYDLQLQSNYVAADFPAIFEQGERDRDVVLQNGDVIVIPRERSQVYVLGRVRHHGWVPFQPGANLEWYIDRAGGYTGAADQSRVIIEKFGTGNWEDPCCTSIESGDRIYVPGERDTRALTDLEQTSLILAIVASAVGIINLSIDIANKL